MIKILISLLLFYFSVAIVFGTLADMKVNSTTYPTLSERLKRPMIFLSFAIVFLILGWVVWPNKDANQLPTYYVTQVINNQHGATLKVKVNKKLSYDELRLVVSKIKQDSSRLNCKEILFFLPEQSSNDRPYALYDSNDGEVWAKMVNIYSGTSGVVNIGQE